ncbi:hypothetical protein D6D23_06244 [Aureobasidium pullulans]|nr:hypothetical protein D6D23_06244 [Aureobasidium pullulans]THZ91079.1 hypothetical protein D6C82_10138 [Aureobasidium pullulans]
MISDLFLSRSRTQLYGYDKVRVPFHAIRAAQLVSSIIVGSIMAFFIYHLQHDHWPTPWTFKVLMSVSWITIAMLATTITLHLRSGLNPRLNLIFNGTVFVIWTMGFGMLSWWMWGTLTHFCDVSHWNDGTGIMVCKIYKALFSFALLGLISTLMAVALDIHISRMNTLRGQHFRLNLRGDRKASDIPMNGPYADINSQSNSHDDLTHSHESLPHLATGDAFEVPTSGSQKTRAGYTIPESQFDYETGYHGGHAERVFGAK